MTQATMGVSAQQDAEMAAHPDVSQTQATQMQQAEPQPLTETERNELEQFRAQKLREAVAALQADEAKPYLYLHLADGRIIKSAGQMTHYKGIQVIGAYPITKEES